MDTSRPLARDARIAIMGAGCAGLTCAEELRERGYHRVTVFEAQGRAGGKIRSVPYAGSPAGGRGLFEAGTVFYIPSPMWTKLLRRHSISETTTFMPRVRIGDVTRGTTSHLMWFGNGYPVMSRIKQVARLAALLQRHGKEHDRRPGVAAHVTPDLCRDTKGWFEDQGLPFVRDVVLPIAGGAQFGPLAGSVPVVYVMRLLALLRRYSLRQQLSRRMPQLKAGHEALWTKIAKTHDLRYGRAIKNICAGRHVTVTTADGPEPFDALIVAAPTAAYLDAASHLADDERRLLAGVRTLDREVVTARVEGLPSGVFYAPRYGADGRVPPAHPYLFYEVDRGSGVFTFHPYLDNANSSSDTDAAIARVVAQFGGRVTRVEHRVSVRGWFPHFTESALRAGAYARLEAMQGRRNVWMAGELLAGIGVPHGMEYAAALVQRMTGAPVHA